ncbi:hypothetical protein GGX14DRAFT_671886 [Mycena pura]|uniref:Uncharacterized protein n=1 Tax=Mycena pura TaxID=153505 RepID=A0AAD6UWU4_9AGAR|nr:hypothetical protein GGX14DRAFT_671886 [Mycena pura]
MDIEAERAFVRRSPCMVGSGRTHSAPTFGCCASTSFSPDALSTLTSLLQKPETGFSPLPPLPASPPISDCSSAASARSGSSAAPAFDSPVPCIFRDEEPHAITATPVSALATMRPDQALAWNAPAPSYPFVHGYGYIPHWFPTPLFRFGHRSPKVPLPTGRAPKLRTRLSPSLSWSPCPAYLGCRDTH